MPTTEIKNVLVIDDNETDLLIAKIVIEKTGYKGNIITKSSGKAALEYLASIQNSPEKFPNIIFLDINMPVINGFVFMDEFEKMPYEFTKHIKLAMLTSSDNRSDMDRFNNSEFVIDFVSKPITFESFNALAAKYQEL
ncbi:MAG: response regulator [Bacteroidota bacterium]|nr:response regulator [Bacteroidota bacterium]